MPNIKPPHLPDLLCVLLLICFALAIALPRWKCGIDWRDEGLLAYGAARVANGEVPHRDFVSVQPPLSYYTVAALFKFCGTSLGTLRTFGLSIFLILPLLIYGVARNFFGPLLSFAAAAPACILGLPYTYFVPLAVWQGILASLAAVFLFLRAAFSKRQWLGIFAGFFTAISLFLRHDQAVYTFVSIFALLIALSFVGDASASRKNLKRAALFWLAGIAIIVSLATAVWWWIGALPETFRQLVVFPFAIYRKTSALPFPKITAGKTAAEIAAVSLFYLPLFVQTIAALWLAQSAIRRRFHLREAILAFLVTWSALFFLQVMVRSDQTHLLMTLPPFFLLTAFAWSIVQESIAKHRKTRLVLSSIFTIAVASYLWILHATLLPDVARAKELLALERGGVRVEGANLIADFVRTLQNDIPPARSILALPYQPMFYFLCERRNPTRWNYLWPGDQTPQDHERFIDEAERDPPAMVLLAQERELAADAPAIAEYVRIHYLRTDQFGNLAIYERLDTR